MPNVDGANDAVAPYSVGSTGCQNVETILVERPWLGGASTARGEAARFAQERAPKKIRVQASVSDSSRKVLVLDLAVCDG
jgi:hypothetical protein